ncbi:MAG: phage head-tail adapter protein [Treponema sp.]|nr:phage head-tail adapter protein [Treponema sp.]
MNKEWCELNKTMQLQIKKQNSFADGIDILLELRAILMDEIMRFKKDLSREDFNAIPYINAKGYHSKTIAYSLWHIFRIEDIVCHTLIQNDDEVLFAGDYQKKIGSPIITTGNEFVKQQIADFSSKLNLTELYDYVSKVYTSTNSYMKKLDYKELKRKMTDEDRKRLVALNVVSTDENAFWLVDYWCGKTVQALIQMPFSRHWIMHIEACERIEGGVRK